jgi:hypothetical protein
MNAQINAPIFIAQTKHDYARMLLQRNLPSDNDKALHLLTEALATANHLGLETLADRARSLKLTAETSPAPALPKA